MGPVLALHQSFLLFLTFSPQISILRPSKLSIPDKRTMSMNNKVSHSNRLITSLSWNFFICSSPETLSFCPQSFSVIIINYICLKFRKTFQQWRLFQSEPNWTKIDFTVLVCLFINIILSFSFFFFLILCRSCQERHYGSHQRVSPTHLFTLQASRERAILDSVRKKAWVRI